MLEEITKLHIDYLSHLDYVDFNSLANTSKHFFQLLNNDTILRNILYKCCDNDIYLPPDFQISKALNALYNEINAFTYKLYPDDMEWYKWINIEIFRNDLKRNIYINLYNLYSKLLYNDEKDILDGNIIIIIDKMKISTLNQPGLIFPFIAYNDEYLCDSDIRDNKFYKQYNTELKLSDLILDYFKHSLKNLFNKYNKFNRTIENNLSILLFIRDYTHKSRFEV